MISKLSNLNKAKQKALDELTSDQSRLLIKQNTLLILDLIFSENPDKFKLQNLSERQITLTQFFYDKGFHFDMMYGIIEACYENNCRNPNQRLFKSIINENMKFDVKEQSADLYGKFDEDLFNRIMREEEIRKIVKSLSDFVAIINEGFCTELELQELKQQCDHALKYKMFKEGYARPIDFCDAGAICEIIGCMPYSEMELQRMINACDLKLKKR